MTSPLSIWLVQYSAPHSLTTSVSTNDKFNDGSTGCFYFLISTLSLKLTAKNKFK